MRCSLSPEWWRRARGASTDQAIRFGTATTGSIITAAALIMIVVCGAFGFSSIVMMKYIAFGMVIALILDATVIRMLLVPAVMHLLREDSWWFGMGQKLSEKVGHNEQLSGTSAAHPMQPVPAGSQLGWRVGASKWQTSHLPSNLKLARMLLTSNPPTTPRHRTVAPGALRLRAFRSDPLSATSGICLSMS